MGVNNLIEIFDEKYYRHLSGGNLEAFLKMILPRFKSVFVPDEEIQWATSSLQKT